MIEGCRYARGCLWCGVMLLTLLQSSVGVGAPADNAIRGFSRAQSVEQRLWEEKMRAVPSASLLRAYMEFLASEPHHLGSAKGKANADWMLEKFRSWGLEAWIEEYRVLFPTPKARHLELLAPEKYVALLKEPVIAEDPDSSDAGQLPTYNAYSADGDVTAQVVYVNYGLPSDYEMLRKLGIDVRGKIALARYGASWRGIKPKVAYENGAIACLIYSDPKDDGFYNGSPYPEGPFRPEHGVQRGSVADMPIHPGDPLTPGVGATADARRLSLSEAATITKIPVMPISYGDALPILKNLGGRVAPEAWRGALPVTYRIGPGPALVHFKMESNWDQHTLYNVFARIPGAEFPDEWVVQGNHHDAWVNGATDPTSGMVALLEQARALGELTKQGWKPRRTIVFAAWDGEEQGLLGSTEWAEHHAAELREKMVAYINTDSNGKGWLSAGGSHSLERFLNEVAQDIADPVRGRSVHESLRDRKLDQAREDKDRRELRERADLRISALGSGSDYTAFLDHLGIASLNVSFGGDGGGGVYHSIYDSVAWYTRFSDSSFVYGRALAQLNGTAVMRLANARFLPFEFTNLAETVEKYTHELEELSKKEGNVNVGPLREAQRTLMKSARAFEAAYSRAVESGGEGRSGAELQSINQRIYQSERLLTSAGGLPGRPWFRHQLYAPGFYTGYGVKTVPYVREALEERQWDVARQGVRVVRDCLMALAGHLDALTRTLSPR